MNSEEALIIAIASMAEEIKRKDKELIQLEDSNKELNYEVARLRTQLAETGTPICVPREPQPDDPSTTISRKSNPMTDLREPPTASC